MTPVVLDKREPFTVGLVSSSNFLQNTEEIVYIGSG
jgi:hypothetical protein